MAKSYTPNENPYRTPEEVDALKAVIALDEVTTSSPKESNDLTDSKDPEDSKVPKDSKDSKELIHEAARRAKVILNRSLHRKSYDEIHYTTLQDKIVRDGIPIQECLVEECQKGLEMYEVTFENGKMASHRIPESAIHPFDKDKAVPVYNWAEIEKQLERRNQNRSEDNQMTIEQVKENPDDEHSLTAIINKVEDG